MRSIQRSQTDTPGLVAKSITAGEPGNTTSASVDRRRRQQLIQPLEQNTTVCLDEFAVHTRDVDLAQVYTRAGMLLDPFDEIQQLVPDIG
jgi:hypothetical protein